MEHMLEQDATVGSFAMDCSDRTSDQCLVQVLQNFDIQLVNQEQRMETNEEAYECRVTTVGDMGGDFFLE